MELIFYPVKVIGGVWGILNSSLILGLSYIPLLVFIFLVYSSVTTSFYDFCGVKKCLIMKGARGEVFTFDVKTLMDFS